MNFYVNFTTIQDFTDWLCPYNCRGCGRLGKAFCACCKYDNGLGMDNYCPCCKKVVEGKCVECGLPFDACYMVGWYQGQLGKLVRDYKFHSVRGLARELAQILDMKLPYFDEDVVVVPLPTIDRHVRERGFDHVGVLAREFCRLRGYRMERLIGRKNNTVQVGAERVRRIRQAGNAYFLKKAPDKNVTYLLIDDVWTTGSSLMAAAKLLWLQGAESVACAVLTVNNAAD